MLSRYNNCLISDKNYNNFIKDKRIVIVGPSNNTNQTNQRNMIENYDIVVRLNKTFNIPVSKQKDIGKRTDILYNSMNTTDYPGENNIDKQIIYELKRNRIKYISIPYPFIYPFEKDITKFIQTNENMIPYHIINIHLYKYIINVLKNRPYTGTCAILDILSYPIKELYITGIDCYINKYYEEYRTISHSKLTKLRNNNIHSSAPQLLLIKKLALSDNRLKLDRFLENYLFKNEYKIYKTLHIESFLYNLDKKHFDKNFSELIKDKYIIYSNKTIQRTDIFSINLSLNYENIDKYSNMYINLNNGDINKNLRINNNIDIFIDFNKELAILKSIQKYTDIENIYFIDKSIITHIKNERFFKKMSLIYLTIILLCNIFDKTIYIDSYYFKELSEEEKTMILYYQYLNQINIINL